MNLNAKDDGLKKIKEEVMALDKSPLYSERIKNKVFPVIGEGNHDAAIMFIGEAPGKAEAASGRPFVGASGKILTKLLEEIGLKREEVYITNIVKDRPPENRDPQPEEIEIYGPFLDRQINIIQPRVIATLGRFSMIYIMNKFSLQSELLPINQMHGKNFEAVTSYGKINIIPLYHPAASIYNQSLKEVLKEDFKILKKYG